MNRHDLATIIRDFLKKNSDVDTVEATVKEAEGVILVRYYNKQKLVGEVMRILVCLSLAGCGFIAGLDEYTPAHADVHEDAADSADPPGEGGAADAADGGIDSNTMPDAAPEADASADAGVDAQNPDASPDVVTCTPPAAFDCGGATAAPVNQICIHDNANGADNVGVIAAPCATCETYTCACVRANEPTSTGCSYTAEGGIIATIH